MMDICNSVIWTENRRETDYVLHVRLQNTISSIIVDVEIKDEGNKVGVNALI